MKKIKIALNHIKKYSQLGRENHLDSHSAAAAFFIFVAIIPATMLILALIPYTPLTSDSILSVARLVLPKRLDSFAVDIIDQLSDNSLTIISISAITAVWTASRSVLTIKQGLNEIHGLTETRNFIIIRINAAFYMLILIVSVMLMLIINVVFTGLERYLREVLSINIATEFSLLHLLVKIRPIVTIVIAFVVNIYFFTFLPNRKVKMKSQIPGAVFTAISWYLFSVIFNAYINNFNAYSMYGSMSVVIITLIWLYECMYFMFLGGQLNYYLIKERGTEDS